MEGSLHLGIHVSRPAGEVYAYVADRSHLPRWAAGVDDATEVRFVAANEHLVLDHDVTLPDGSVTRNPMRVLPDADGCEVVFTLRRAPGTSQEAYDADAAAVRADLATLKRLLEDSPGPDHRNVTDHPEAGAWAGEQVRLTGEAGEPHDRPWSSAVRLGTTSGPVWLKVNGRGSRHEPALLRLLADRVPGLVPEVLAVDDDRGWSLTRDAGPILREALSPPESWPAWERVVGEYAAAQLELSDARDPVLAAGVAEVSPATLPLLTRDLVDELGRLPVTEGGLTGDEAERIEALLPRLDDWCAELEASPVPDSIQHDDLHSGNVCWSGTATVIDWGDASWGFPLATMLCTLASLSDAAPALSVRDAYLEPFTTYASHAELVHLVELAVWVGCVTRALSWRAAMLDVPPTAHDAWGFPVRSWLLELLSR